MCDPFNNFIPYTGISPWAALWEDELLSSILHSNEQSRDGLEYDMMQPISFGPGPGCTCHSALWVENNNISNQSQPLTTDTIHQKSYRDIGLETDECVRARYKEISTQTEPIRHVHNNGNRIAFTKTRKGNECDKDLVTHSNQTGCARTENFLWAFTNKDGDKICKILESDRCGSSKAPNNQTKIDFSEKSKKVFVNKSNIHSKGLFCLKDMEINECVTEVTGEIIRTLIADKREKIYESKGIGCYMHRLDSQFVLDSTEKGNEARFINHSCDPNCATRIVKRCGKMKVFVYSLRKLQKGEEVTINYNFPIEDRKIPCSCGTQKCRKYLN